MAITENLLPVAVAAAVGAATFPAMNFVDDKLGRKPYVANGVGLVVGGLVAAYFADDNSILAAAGLGFAAASAFGLATEYKHGLTPFECDASCDAAGKAKALAASAPKTTSTQGAMSSIVGALPSGGYKPIMSSKDMMARDPRIAAVRAPSWAR